MSTLEDLEVAASRLNLGDTLTASSTGLEDRETDIAQPTDANVISRPKVGSVQAVPHPSPAPSSTSSYSTTGTPRRHCPLPTTRTNATSTAVDLTYTRGLPHPVNHLYRPSTPALSLLPLPDPQSPRHNCAPTSSISPRTPIDHNSAHAPFSTRCLTRNPTSTRTRSSGLSTQSRPMSTTSANNSSSTTSTSASQTTPPRGSSQSTRYPSRLMETPGRNKNKFYVVVVGRRTGIFDDW